MGSGALARRALEAAVAVLAVFVVGCSSPTQKVELGELAAQLSEDGAYFDTDNLISNETSYPQVVDKLSAVGGVYIGVGPEQNFHYIGRLRPEWAFIVDVRRDNQLHHLLLNAILVSAETPADYLCWLFARRCDTVRTRGPADEAEDLGSWFARVERQPPDEALFEEHLQAVYRHADEGLGFPLSEEDQGVIAFIYRSYFDEQLGLRFRSHGRRPMPHHPTYRSLLLAQSPGGTSSHFLFHEDDYAYVRSLAMDGRLIPVVGDFAGDHALRAVGKFAESQGVEVTAFYVSNVEFYLMRNGVFPDYIDNVRALPLAEDAQFIRAYFSYGYPHPEALPGHRSTLVRQNMKRFLELYDAGAYRDYWDVSTLDYAR